MSKGRTIRMFLADGTPSGIITAEIMNWTGHVVVAPRSRLADLMRRPELGRTGLYILLGETADSDDAIYIGESDNVGKRLALHNRDPDKDFWDRVCVVTSKDQNLTKAHARYLESQLIASVSTIGQTNLANGSAPDFALLPEADLADMDFFLEQIRIVLPALGLTFLRPPSRAFKTSDGSGAASESPPPTTFVLRLEKQGVSATAQESDGSFIVLKGSKARGEWVGSNRSSQAYDRLYETLCAKGVLQTQGDVKVFAEDYAFSSPSAASAIVTGRSSNGRVEWKVKGSSQTYAQHQEAEVDRAEASLPDS